MKKITLLVVLLTASTCFGQTKFMAEIYQNYGTMFKREQEHVLSSSNLFRFGSQGLKLGIEHKFDEEVIYRFLVGVDFQQKDDSISRMNGFSTDQIPTLIASNAGKIFYEKDFYQSRSMMFGIDAMKYVSKRFLVGGGIYANLRFVNRSQLYLQTSQVGNQNFGITGIDESNESQFSVSVPIHVGYALIKKDKLEMKLILSAHMANTAFFQSGLAVRF